MGMPGPIELLIVLVSGLLACGVSVAILVIVIIIFLRQRGESESTRAASSLIEENQALRKELEELKSRQRNAPPES